MKLEYKKLKYQSLMVNNEFSSDTERKREESIETETQREETQSETSLRVEILLMVEKIVEKLNMVLKTKLVVGRFF